MTRTRLHGRARPALALLLGCLGLAVPGAAAAQPQPAPDDGAAAAGAAPASAQGDDGEPASGTEAPRGEGYEPRGAGDAGDAGDAGSEGAPPHVGARDGDERAAPRADSPMPEGGVSPKRARPDYDGRGDDPTSARDVALWVPRVVLSPLYLVSEYVVRRPLEWLISTAERNQWPSVIANFFFFGPDKKAGVVPTAFLDLGFRASVGVYAFWDDLLGKRNHLRLHFSTFGEGWMQGAVADRIPVGRDATLDVRLEGMRRPDQVFHGLGPSSRQADASRFGLDRLQGRSVFESTWWRASRVSVEAGARLVGFRDDTCCDDPSLARLVAAGRLPEPPALSTGYSAVFQRAELTIDSRAPRPASQDGLRVELEVEQAADIRHSGTSWLRYGGSVGGFVDVGDGRTLSLSGTALFVDPMAGGTAIPFTEQIVLGGNGPMRGYLYGRLVDRSAVVTTLKYRWPIWVYLDGAAQASLGNVFGSHLDGFDPRKLRLSTAIGIETVGSADNTFEFLAGFGTETLEEGLGVTSVRLLFGTNRGF